MNFHFLSKKRVLFLTTIFYLLLLPVTAFASDKVIAGGQSIGILLDTEGVTIIGFSPVAEESGSSREPATEAGLHIGDFITSINGQTVQSNEDIERLVNEIGQQGNICTVEFRRNGVKGIVEVPPAFCNDTQTWRIGIYVRDNLAGVGTLTFYDPETNTFGALGHGIQNRTLDSASSQIGQIFRASVQGIKASTAGSPGEKIGTFLKDPWKGEIQRNGDFGIYGTADSLPYSEQEHSYIEIAAPDEVTVGPAKIYTVLENETVEAFDVSVVKIFSEHKINGKGMIIEITDEELLEICGGIVQGMSGSPIIQNGKLIGAISHVFINDPTHGYGCHIQWMLDEAS